MGAVPNYDAEWEALPEDHKQRYKEYHQAELAAEVSARRERSTQVLVPVSDVGAGSLAQRIPGPGGEEVQVLNHVVGGGRFTKHRRRESGRLLESTPMTAESLESTLATESKTIRSAAQLVDSQHTMPLARDKGAVGKVRYHRPCLGVCVEHKDRASQNIRSMTSMLGRAMQDMLKASNNAAPELKTLFIFEKW